MKKILLIGQTGQLGQSLIKDASLFDFKIISFVRKELDITNPAQLEKNIAELKPNILINTSAYHVVPKCEEKPELAFLINSIAVHQAAKICQKYQIQFVTYSTDYVFDGTKRSPYIEDDYPNPLQIYGLSKLAGEYAVLNYYPKKSFVIRTCGLYGGKEGSPQKGGNFVLSIIEQVKKQTVTEVACEQIISPTYAGDLSKATLKLLKKNTKGGIYHLVNEGHCSWYQFAREILKLAKINKKLIPVDRSGKSGNMNRPLFSALKNTKAKKLGVVLPPWQTGLKTYLYEMPNLQ